MESPAPSPLHQEHLQGESGLGREPSGWEVEGTGWMETTKGCEANGGAIPEASSYRDQGEDCVDHTSSDGGICWLPYPRRLENAG